MRDRSFAVNFAARALPPFAAASRPSATAAGFFFVCFIFEGMSNSLLNFRRVSK
jgi:hypothetical protein